MTLAVVPPPQQSAPSSGRVPPNDLGAERAVIGCCLLDAECWSLLSGMLKPEHFYADKHGTIWRAFEALARKGSAIDTDLLRSQLAATPGQLERVGGDEYVLSLTDTIPMTAHAEDLAKRVLDTWLQREVIRTAYEIASEGYQGVESAADYAQRAATAFAAVSDRRGKAVASVSIGDAVRDELVILERRADNGQRMQGHRSGFVELDEVLSGFCAGDFYVIGARPGMGKTAFVNGLKLGIARNAAMQVISFEFEMTQQQLVHRFWAAEAEINMRLIRGAELGPDAFKFIARENEKLARLPIELVFNRSLRMSELCRFVEKRKRTHGPIGLVTVDYLQRVPADDSRQSREQQMSANASALKTLSGVVGCPVAAISSLNRDLEKRPGDKRPIMSDLRESGNLEYEADTILFLYRDELYHPDKPENLNDPGRTEVLIGKQRSGPFPTMRLLRFTKEFTRFDNWDSQQREAQQGFGYEDER